MARGGGSFSSEEIQLLRGLPAVANVTQDRITYSDTFKQVCTIRYLAGESPTKIFREAGLPPDLVGYKRIERSVARWKAAAIKSVNGSDSMSDGEIIAQLVDRYRRALVTRKNLDSIAENIIGMESDASVAATNAEASLKAMQPSSPQTADTGRTRSMPRRPASSSNSKPGASMNWRRPMKRSANRLRTSPKSWLRTSPKFASVRECSRWNA